VEGAATPSQNPLQRWAQSFEDLVIAFAEFFLALSCMLFWGVRMLLKFALYGGPKKKKPWITKLLKLLSKIIKIALEAQKYRRHKKKKKANKKENG